MFTELCDAPPRGSIGTTMDNTWTRWGGLGMGWELGRLEWGGHGVGTGGGDVDGVGPNSIHIISV